MKTLLKNLAELLKVKSIITLTVIAGATYGFVVGIVDGAVYAAFAASIITYYFTRNDINPR